MKVVIPGGSGQVGGVLARHFLAAGDEVVLLSRRADASASESFGAKVVAWDGCREGPWQRELDGADVVINLAGRSVDCRYHAANRRQMLDSRVDSTRAVGRAIAAASRPPRVWLQASTATIYRHAYDRPQDEATGELGGNEPDAPAKWRFSIEVAKAWEAAAREFDLPGVRLVLLRSAMTMSPDRGGIFGVLLGLVRRGLGGTCGDGRQYVSWIHDCDFVRAIDWLIARDDFSGPVNLASPHPLPNAEFMRELRQAWETPLGLPAARWMLEAGAVVLRTESELVLKSRRVVPGRLLGAGFGFEFPEWRTAAIDLCRRWRGEGRLAMQESCG
ncbi:MAG: TIGR01777 family oxidoreductase [Planctomycetales bacterium]|nr:TIGR01777 family oxidoreductase [Planctomycetales bacterium]